MSNFSKRQISEAFRLTRFAMTSLPNEKETGTRRRVEKGKASKPCLRNEYFKVISTLKMSETRVIQITNVAPVVTKEQMRTLFSFVGKIDDIKLYPER